MRSFAWWLLAVGVLWLPAVALAAAEAREPWRLDDALGLHERLSIEGDVRVRHEYLDNQFRAGRPGRDEILAIRTRVRALFRATEPTAH